jgi:hypothetical protein
MLLLYMFGHGACLITMEFVLQLDCLYIAIGLTCFGTLCSALQVGVFLQHMTTFIVGFIVAFTRGWDMTLVLVGCLPFLAAIGAVLASLQTKLASKQTAAYTEVGACGLCALPCDGVCCYEGDYCVQLQGDHAVCCWMSAFSHFDVNNIVLSTLPCYWSQLMLDLSVAVPAGWLSGAAKPQPDPHSSSIQWRGGGTQAVRQQTGRAAEGAGFNYELRYLAQLMQGCSRPALLCSTA